jgi:hypothetical protein
VEAEGSREGAEDAGGSWDFGEKFLAVFGGEEGLELGGTHVGFVVGEFGGQPVAGGGEALGGGRAGLLVGAVALFGQRAGLPVGDEFFESLDGAADVAVDADEVGGFGAVFVRNLGDDGVEAGEDGSEEGGEWVHWVSFYM